jgi:hypothetical protein
LVVSEFVWLVVGWWLVQVMVHEQMQVMVHELEQVMVQVVVYHWVQPLDARSQPSRRALATQW